MRADYRDHRALDDDQASVYLIVKVPDGRVLLHRNQRKRLVPRLSGDWQCTLSKKLMRGQRNDAALRTLVFTTFGWPEKAADPATFLLRFGINKKTIFIYLLTLEETVYIQPGQGADLMALPWKEVVHKVMKKEMEFSDETYPVVDIINNLNGGRF